MMMMMVVTSSSYIAIYIASSKYIASSNIQARGQKRTNREIAL